MKYIVSISERTHSTLPVRIFLLVRSSRRKNISFTNNIDIHYYFAYTYSNLQHKLCYKINKRNLKV